MHAAHGEHPGPYAYRRHPHGHPRQPHTAPEIDEPTDRREHQQSPHRRGVRQARQAHRRGGTGNGRGGRQQRQEQRRQAVAQRPQRAARRALVREPVFGAAHLPRGRTRPARPLLHRLVSGDGGTRLHVRALPDLCARHERGARADAGLRADRHLAHVQFVTVEPHAGQVHLRLDGRALAHGEQARDWGEGVHVYALADVGAKHPAGDLRGVRAGDVQRAGRVQPALGGPQAHMPHPAARVHAGCDPPADHTRSQSADRDAPKRGA